MNVGIVTTWFERGAAYVSKAYLDTLSSRHNVFIYARAGERYAKGDPDWDKDYVTWGKTVPGHIVTYVDFDDFEAWVDRKDIGAVIFNEQHSWDIVIRARKLGISLGAYVDYYTPETVPFFKAYDFLLCNTQRHFGVFRNHPKAVYIPWGTDLEVYHPSPDRHDQLTFFHSCGLSPLRKGTDLTIRAFRQVKGDARLIIHAQGDFQLDEATAAVLAQDRRIEVIDKEVGAPGLYKLGDVYVYPSRLEGIGLTMAEALASGLPLITTDAPPMNEFVADGVNGRLVDVEKYQRRADNYYWPESICNEASLARAMQHYVDHYDRIDEYRAGARRYAEERLDWKKNSRCLADAIGNMPRSDRIDPALRQSIVRYERSRSTSRLSPYYWLNKFRRQPGRKRIKSLPQEK